MTGLTAKSVEAARSTNVRREIPDAFMRGLYLIVQPSGTKTWAVRYRLGGRSAKHTIGPYPAFDLKQARDAAAKVLRTVAEGHSPKRPDANTVQDAIDQFLKRHCRDYRPRSLKEAERLLRLYVVKPWRNRKLDSITRADVRAMLDGIAAPIAANRVYKIVRTFFTWCTRVDLISTSPVTGIVAPSGKETSRDRVLTDAELKAVWLAADNVGYPFGPIVQLLILTGQRRSEVADMMWSEIDGQTWTLPRERTKNDRRHDVPLSHQAMAIIERLPRIGDRYLFTLSGTKPYKGFRGKDQLGTGISAWTLHDLRRTAASGMARLGVNLTVIEKVLNHVSGSLAGIVGVYQRHEFAEEKRTALQQWADYVERLISASRVP